MASDGPIQAMNLLETGNDYSLFVLISEKKGECRNIEKRKTDSATINHRPRWFCLIHIFFFDMREEIKIDLTHASDVTRRVGASISTLWRSRLAPSSIQ